MRIRLSYLVLFLLPFLELIGQPAISFIENKCQWDKRVRYRGDVSNGEVYIREGGITFVRHDPNDLRKMAELKHGISSEGKSIAKNTPITIHSHSWNVDFIGANAHAILQAEKQLAGSSNYFMGNDPSNWAGDCKSYQGITISNLYPNIDLRYYTDRGVLKYDLVVRPGGDPNQIELKYTGVDGLAIKDQSLTIQTSLGTFQEGAPYSYQATEQGRKTIRSSYRIQGDRVRFQLKDYDRSQTLVIDPSIVFCSFTGSSNDNWGFTATYGPDGSFFGGGIVFDSGGSFPTSPGAFQTTYTSSPFEMCIMKLTPDGSNRVYATYIG